MDKAERQRLKTLANDAIIRCFGVESHELKLAQALESSVEELELIAEECQHCKLCSCHGDHSDEMLPVDAGEVLSVHGELKNLLKTLKDYHVRLSGELVDEFPDLLLPDELAGIVEEIEQQVDELEACVTP